MNHLHGPRRPCSARKPTAFKTAPASIKAGDSGREWAGGARSPGSPMFFVGASAMRWDDAMNAM